MGKVDNLRNRVESCQHLTLPAGPASLHRSTQSMSLCGHERRLVAPLPLFIYSICTYVIYHGTWLRGCMSPFCVPRCAEYKKTGRPFVPAWCNTAGPGGLEVGNIYITKLRKYSIFIVKVLFCFWVLEFIWVHSTKDCLTSNTFKEKSNHVKEKYNI